jgi:hypothetical protein
LCGRDHMTFRSAYFPVKVCMHSHHHCWKEGVK